MVQKFIFFIYLISFSITLFSNTTHVLKEGETLYALSKKYNIEVSTLISSNQIDDISALSVGSKITIPNNTLNYNEYIVVKGDTLFSISKRHNMSLDQLMSQNDLVAGDYISLGQKLKISNEYQMDKQIKPESKVVINDNPTSIPYWPLTGEISDYEGRIRGVQISGKSGDFIQAVAPGKVIWYDSYKGIGKVVLIQSENGYDYLYGTTEDFNVSMGGQVSAGERLGRLNESNTSVNFSIFKNGEPLSNLSEAPR